jgi:C-terminal processing protease CtpA/Prc
MGKLAAYLLIGIGVGFGFAYWQGAGRSAAVAVADPGLADGAPLAVRLGELETALALERYQREALADELQSLRQALVEVSAAGSGDSSEAGNRAAAARAGDSGEDRAARRLPEAYPQTAEAREQYLRQRQIDNFVAAGLSPDRAHYILERQDTLEWEALEARYQAGQSGATAEELARLNVGTLLRAELGDRDYERYLEGMGRTTTVRVNEVLQNSPAQAVGLQPGDEIIAYNGKRVFDIGELTGLTNALRPGETVALEIERDGQPIQFFVESGPIGISGGGRSTRRDGR